MVTSAFAQGTINWLVSSSSGGAIAYSLDGATQTSVPTGNPAQVPGYGSLNVDFFFAPAGTALTPGPTGPAFTTAWTEGTTILHQISVQPGRESTTVTTPGNFAGGANVQMEVVGWTGTATSWAAELAAPGGTLLGWTGETFNASALGALSWTQATGAPNASPPGTPAALTTGASGYAGLVLEPVPEPATIALGGLGAAALLMFRRRK